MGTTPTVYILHGDDEFGITQFIAAMREKLGDPATADMNTTRLEGPVDMGALKNAVSAAPFLAPRRLVILTGALRFARGKEDRQRLQDLLESIHPATALVLVEKEPLKENHWLLAWARGRGEHIFERALPLPKGGALVRWVRDYARVQGGEISQEAAYHLVQMIGDDNRAAAQEVEKLLAYAGFRRAVDVDDVELLVAPVEEGDVFAMVDAIGGRQPRQALTMLHRLLSEREPLSLFGMVVRQFRLLLLYKELHLENTAPAEIARSLKIHEFVVRKLAGQAKNFSLKALEDIYLRLVEIDERIKTGKISPEAALDTLVAGLTA
jgi:DNA polymerase-3 subunit delta